MTITATTNPYPDAAPPPGAIAVYEWDKDNGRYFRGRTWAVEGTGFEVMIDGTQYADGTEEREIVLVNESRECLTGLAASVARGIGQALIEAADSVSETQR